MGSNRENEIQAEEMSFSTGCLGSQTQISATAPAHWPFDKDASCLAWESLSVPHQKSEVAAKVSLLILISIFYQISRFGSAQRNPHFPHPGHLFQLICGDAELLSSHPRDIISSAGPVSEQGPPPSKIWLEYLTQKASRRHPSQMPRNLDQDKCQKMDQF